MFSVKYLFGEAKLVQIFLDDRFVHVQFLKPI